MNHENIRMIERADCLRLLLETTQTFRVFGIGDRQDFYGHVSSQTGIACAIHFTHPARAQRRKDFVWSKSCADSNGHVSGGNARRLFKAGTFYLCWGEEGRSSQFEKGLNPKKVKGANGREVWEDEGPI